MIGSHIGPYRVLHILGEGSMGKVLLALDTLLEREVALKTMRPELMSDEQFVQRFRAEAVTVARLQHPHIASLYSLHAHGSELVMVMEFIQGVTLEHLLRDRGPLHWRAACTFACQILDAIDYAHRNGVVHRDLKPANVLVRPDGAVKVTDFGIAKILGQSRQTRVGRVIGTIEYMSPERLLGKPEDHRADIYAIGIVLYEMLTAQLPFDHQSEYELMRAQIESPPRHIDAHVAGVPGQVRRAIATALEKDASNRFPTAALFREELLAALGEAQTAPTFRTGSARETRLLDLPSPEPESAPPPPPRSLPALPASWRRYAAIALGFVLLSLVWALLPDSPRQAPPVTRHVEAAQPPAASLPDVVQELQPPPPEPVRAAPPAAPKRKVSRELESELDSILGSAEKQP